MDGPLAKAVDEQVCEQSCSSAVIFLQACRASHAGDTRLVGTSLMNLQDANDLFQICQTTGVHNSPSW